MGPLGTVKAAVALLLAAKTLAVSGLSLNSMVRDVERVESVREIKDVQRTFSHLAQFGRWTEMASLFSVNGVFRYGNATSTPSDVKGPEAIGAWLRNDTGNMDGARPGSMNLWLTESPLVSLSPDGSTAKTRWNTLRFMGDGIGATRIQGGIFENEYVREGTRWKISLLHYYIMYAGSQGTGWRSTGNGTEGNALPVIPYHFTPDSAGIPILRPLGSEESVAANTTVEALQHRIARLNDEDDVRNLQHSYGYYVDRRLWSDVEDLFVPNATIRTNGVIQIQGVRAAMERMGPAGLSRGILNDYPMFDTIVDVNSDEAIARGIEIGMIGDITNSTATWKFSIFRNSFIRDKDQGVWKIQKVDITQLIVANYTTGWGHGSISPSRNNIQPPTFIDISRRGQWSATNVPESNVTVEMDLTELQRRLSRSAAYDSSENDSAGYGFFLDDIRCDKVGGMHAKAGHKVSPGTGWYQTSERISKACLERYNTTNPNPMRGSVPFHWRPQPVIHVSQDGKSATLRARLLQFGTSASGGSSFGAGMYHDQTVLEKETGLWKAWSTTIDEFYWTSANWTVGWGAVNPPRNITAQNGTAPRPSGGGLSGLPADLSLKDKRLENRYEGLSGGSGKPLSWPDIQNMWFNYRNPVSGRLPQFYWPGCVPCKARPEWSLGANGYQEPPTGPTLVTALLSGSKVAVTVVGGPEEPVTGLVELREGGTGILLTSSPLADGNGNVTLVVPSGQPGDSQSFTILYLGSDRLRSGQTTVARLRAR